jgi:hypothetical protein
MYHKEYKCYTIHRYSWWKFWQIDLLSINLPSCYSDAYEPKDDSEVLMDWVKKDVLEQLTMLVGKYQKLLKKAKKLEVKFYTTYCAQKYVDGIYFYIDGGDIFLYDDVAIRRNSILESLGI